MFDHDPIDHLVLPRPYSILFKDFQMLVRNYYEFSSDQGPSCSTGPPLPSSVYDLGAERSREVDMGGDDEADKGRDVFKTTGVLCFLPSFLANCKVAHVEEQTDWPFA